MLISLDEGPGWSSSIHAETVAQVLPTELQTAYLYCMEGYVEDVPLENFATKVLNLLVQAVNNAAHLAGPFPEPVNLPVTANPWSSQQFSSAHVHSTVVEAFVSMEVCDCVLPHGLRDFFELIETEPLFLQLNLLSTCCARVRSDQRDYVLELRDNNVSILDAYDDLVSEPICIWQ